jgi:hypothetical protein
MTRINMMSNYSIERRLKIGNLNKNKIFSKLKLRNNRKNELCKQASESALTRKNPLILKKLF